MSKTFERCQQFFEDVQNVLKMSKTFLKMLKADRFKRFCDELEPEIQEERKRAKRLRRNLQPLTRMRLTAGEEDDEITDSEENQADGGPSGDDSGFEDVLGKTPKDEAAKYQSVRAALMDRSELWASFMPGHIDKCFKIFIT